ncbi:MAG: hypothetical protein R3F56_17700 [Planctomycetota bacterium]
MAVVFAGVAAAQVPQPSLERERVDEDLGFTAAASGLRYRVVEVPQASHATVVAVVRVGQWHDPAGQTGITHVLNTLVTLTQEARPETERWSVKTTGPGTVFAVTCPRAELAARLAELSRFLGGELSFDDDLVARAKARARMWADDFLHVVPGPLSIENARRTLCKGTPAGKQAFGVPAEMEALDAATLRAWFDARVRPEHTTLVVLGGLDRGVVEETCAHAFTRKGERTEPAALTVHDSAQPVSFEQPHARVAAPFVSVAFPTPTQGSRDWLPFVVAMGVVAMRCQHDFVDYRGREAEGGFPFFWWDYRHGDSFALINRRGASSEAGLNRDVAAVRREMLATIRRLRTVAPDLKEVQLAAYEAALSLMLPPYAGQLEAMAKHAALLMPRAELLAMADVLGWPATIPVDLGKVGVSEVVRVLQAALADDKLTWFVLMPKE